MSIYVVDNDENLEELSTLVVTKVNIDIDPGELVTISGEQEITGNKEFSGQLTYKGYEVLTSDNLTVTKESVGLSNVDNTSDLNKPISNAVRNALDELNMTLSDDIMDVADDLINHANKQDNPHNVTKQQVGLSNVDNTSDVNKPISNATKAELNKINNKLENIATLNDVNDAKKYSDDNFVSYIKSQSLTESQKQIARNNIGAGIVNNTVNNLVNYYLKSETYTKDEVNQIVGTIKSFKKEIVNDLPTMNIDENTIYLKAKTNGYGNDYYDEYLHINGNFEFIGSTRVDLSNYVTLNTNQTITGLKNINHTSDDGNVRIDLDPLEPQVIIKDSGGDGFSFSSSYGWLTLKPTTGFQITGTHTDFYTGLAGNTPTSRMGATSKTDSSIKSELKVIPEGAFYNDKEIATKDDIISAIQNTWEASY